MKDRRRYDGLPSQSGDLMTLLTAAIYFERCRRERNEEKRDQICLYVLPVVLSGQCFFFVVLFPHDRLFVEIHAVQKNMSTCLSQNNLWWKFFALLMSLGRLTVEQLLPAERVEFPNERILHM